MKQFRLIISLLIILLCSETIIAQERKITGKAINIDTEEPVQGIDIHIKGTAKVAKTDMNGRFSLMISDTIQNIKFGDIPYMVIQNVEIVNENQYNLWLAHIDSVDIFDLPLEALMNIKVVTAAKHEQKISDIPASVVLITREEIEQYGYTTLDEIFQNVPGFFTMQSYGAADFVFGVRGFFSSNNRNVVIMVNGVSQINDFTNDFKLHEINVPVEAIDRIEIIRGPMSVIYGNNAVFGAINIITDDMKDKTDVVTSMYGSRNTQKLATTVHSAHDDFHVNFHLGYFHTDGIAQDVKKMVHETITNANGEEIPNPLWNKTTKGLYNRTEKYANVNGKIKHLLFDVTYTETEKGHSYFTFPPSRYWFSPIAARISAGYKRKISDKFSIHAKGMYNITRAEARFKLHSANDYGPLLNDCSAYQTEINGFISPRPDLDITVGLYSKIITKNTERYDITASGGGTLERAYMCLLPGEKMINYAGFSQISYSPLEKLQLVGGIRLDKYEPYELFITRKTGTPEEVGYYATNKIVDDVNIIPRAAILFHLTSKHSFKFLYGNAINHAPAISNLDVLIFNVMNNKNEPFLKPEKIHTLELNYIATPTENMLINFSLFRNTLNDLLIREVKFEPVTEAYSPITTNAGKAETLGTEFSFSWENKKWNTNISLTYQKTENKRAGYEHIKAGFSPNLMANAKICYAITKDFSIALTGKYIDEMYPFWLGNPQTGNYQGDKTDAFVLINGNIRKDNFFVEGLYANFRLYNIMDTDCIYPTHEVQLWATKGIIGRGRECMFSVGYTF